MLTLLPYRNRQFNTNLENTLACITNIGKRFEISNKPSDNINCFTQDNAKCFHEYIL